MSLLQVTPASGSCTELSEKVPFAVNCCVCPSIIVALGAGVMSILVRAAGPTVTGAEGALSSPATVCVAVITWPAASGGETGSDHVPSGFTAVLPAGAPSRRTLRLAPGMPVPLTVVPPAASGPFTVGAGGGATTVTSAEKALETWATVWRAFTFCPA